VTARLRPLALAVALGALAGDLGAVNGVGPHLDSATDRTAGGASGFSHASATLRKGRGGLVRTPDTLDAHLARPDAHAPGARISYRGMADPADRAALTGRLRDVTAAEPAEDAAVVAEAAPGVYGGTRALAGDPAYGEYLASECVTCHQASGRADGIPSIVGWPREAFMRALLAYKTNARSHEVMRMVTMSLSDEEIAALAAYFGGLTPE
jgi:cytochrome c